MYFALIISMWKYNKLCFFFCNFIYLDQLLVGISYEKSLELLMIVAAADNAVILCPYEATWNLIAEDS